MAGCGLGRDEPALSEASRAKLRRQALDWLHADLVLRDRQLKAGTAEAIAKVRQSLFYWKADRDLGGVRDPDALTKLPDEEQKAGCAHVGGGRRHRAEGPR